MAHCVTNALMYFANHPEWKGKLAWNEFTGELLVKADMPFPVLLKAGEDVRDHHDTLIQSWFERETRNPKWGVDMIRRAVDCWAKQNSFNPIKDYLNGLPEWDRKPLPRHLAQRLLRRRAEDRRRLGRGPETRGFYFRHRNEMVDLDDCESLRAGMKSTTSSFSKAKKESGKTLAGKRNLRWLPPPLFTAT